MPWALPNLLTFSRIALIPFIVALFFCDFFFAYVASTILFVIACITDFFDGHLARSYDQTSRLGRFLDPLADKLLIVVVLFMLAGSGVLQSFDLIPGALILMRELIVASLRNYLSAQSKNLPMYPLAQWKTTLQMVALSLLMLGRYPTLPGFLEGGGVILWMAAGLSCYTGYRYVKGALFVLQNETNDSF